MSEAKFKFFSVGHGLFHVGKIPVKDGNFFTFIYDCGSQTPSVLKSPIDSCIEFFNGKDNKDNINKIDFLFVSHLHYDHINGIRPLIDKLKQQDIRVSNVVLPYVNLYQRVILLLEALNHEEQSQDKFLHNNFYAAFDDYLDFYKNPYNYLKKLFIDKEYSQEELPSLYIVNAPSDCFISDKKNSSELSDFIYGIEQENTENKDVTFKDDTDSEYCSVDNYKVKLSFRERDKNSTENKSDFEFLLKAFYSEDSEADNSYKKHKSSHTIKSVNLKVAKDSLSIIAKDTWKFICFNTPLPSDKKIYIQSLYAEYVSITRANGFKFEDIFSKVNINRLKKHYKNISSDLNSTSLLIYHFPLDQDVDGNLQQSTSFLRKYSSFLLLGDVNLNSYVIYKSTNPENNDKSFLQYLYEKILPLQDASYLRGFNKFENNHDLSHERAWNYVLAPHHGSDNSWNENIFYFLNFFNESSVYIVSTAVDGKHHPGKKFMKSFLKNIPAVIDDELSNSLNIRFLPYLCSADDFLLFLRGNNYLVWCNEEQYFCVDIEMI